MKTKIKLNMTKARFADFVTRIFADTHFQYIVSFCPTHQEVFVPPSEVGKLYDWIFENGFNK